jgi:uncharacterized metal-binding protein
MVFCCSGAADVGELTDRASRRLNRDGLAAHACLARVAARDEETLFGAELAEQVLVIDGCPEACARRALQEAGVCRFLHFDLSELGLRKGKSPVTAQNVQRIVKRSGQLLAKARKPVKKRLSAASSSDD